MIVLKPLRIDLARPARTVVHCMQTDNTQLVDVSLFVNNRPYDVTADVASGETVTMAVAYILPNGFGDEYTETALGETAVAQDGSIKNLYHVMIDGACTDVVGFAQIIVKFTTDGGQILNFFPLTLDVIKSRPDDVDPGGGSPATSRYLRKDLQTPATGDMTQPVGVTPEGLLVTAPGEGGGSGSVTPVSIVTATGQMTATQKTNTRTNIGAAPSTNIAKTALASEVQTSLEHADKSVRFDMTQGLTDAQKSTARTNIGAGTYSKPSGGIPATDMAQAVQTALTAAGTAVQPSALLAYITKAAQANAENFSSALVVSPAGVDDNGAIKSPVALYGTVTRSGTAPNYSYTANIAAGVVYAIHQTYPHMRIFLVDHEGRECTLINPPASDQASLVFYTLDKSGGKVIYYTVATSGATTMEEASIGGGGGGSGEYTGPVITVPTSADDGHILIANADGSTSWASRETIQLVPDQIGMVSISGDYQTVTKKFTRPNPARVICSTPDTSMSNLEGVELRLEWFNDTTQAMMLIGIHGAKEYFVTLTQGGTASNRVMTGLLTWRPLGDMMEPSVVTKTGASQSFSISDNTIYECETLTALTISSVPATAASIITFTSGSTATTASFPATVLFSDDQPDVTNGVFAPSANYAYEINIRNRKALVSRWAVSA